jgi:hypothetical protein
VPILAGIPVVVQPPQVDLLEESRSLRFARLDGSNPLPATGREFFFQPGIEGLDLPPRVIVTKQSPGMDGERLREIRTGRREVFLPLFIASDSSHAQYLDRRDALRGLFDYRGVDYKTADGTFDLVAESTRGTRTLRCVYVEGMSAAKWPNESTNWARLGITVWALNPYWQGARWQTPVIRQSTNAAWFGAFPGKLASTYALGTGIPITIPGDAPSPVTVDLVGPATSVTISAPGLLVSVPAGLASGEVAQIVTDPRARAARFAGTLNWSRVGPTSKWAPLEPGPQTIDIVVAGVGTGTQAVVSGPTNWDSPW